VIFRQPGCLSKTHRLSAPFSRMVEYYRLPSKFLCMVIISTGCCQNFSKGPSHVPRSPVDSDLDTRGFPGSRKGEKKQAILLL
jgi:hypothetical protein